MLALRLLTLHRSGPPNASPLGPTRPTMPESLHDLTLTEAADLLRRREASSVDLTLAAFKHIHALDDRIHAFLTLTKDVALEQARAADERIARGESEPLTGIPAAIKDVIVTQGVETTCGSRILKGFVPPYDAHVMERLKNAGLVMLGKTNMDEFAMGSSGENSAFGPTANPWALDRVPGGSSSGSAAAVASGMAYYALGSDTGGSIRQPASLSGVVGLKPTYGRVSRYGLVAFASSLDQIGPFARSVRDSALIMNAIAGHDLQETTSLNEPVPDYSAGLGRDLRGVRLGLAKEYMIEGADPQVKAAMDAAVKHLNSLGADIVDVSLPHTDYATAVYYILAT